MGLHVNVFMVGLGFKSVEGHVGYLHLIEAALICSSFFCSSWVLVQTVLVLCMRVLNTPCIAGKMWWLCLCRNCSVWVGVL